MKCFTIIFCTLAIILFNTVYVQAADIELDIELAELEEYGQNAALNR